MNEPMPYDTLAETNRTPQLQSELEAQVVAALKTVYDPEIPVDIYELGLIYKLDIDEESGHVAIAMTLTAPGCPVAGTMPAWVQEAVEGVEGVESVAVEMVWEPPWTPDRMSLRAKLELNML
jgi:FeS assembly SUF system protein